MCKNRFVIINAENGSVITTDGRNAIMSDPEGLFPSKGFVDFE